ASAEEAACERLAERLLEADAAAEAGYRALMRLHARRGHENAALRQFDLCRAALRKHLDAEPEAETALLAASLQVGTRTARELGAPSPAFVSHPRTSAVPAVRHDGASIAVLPFQNLGGDPEQEYFADGMVEDIVTALAHFRDLFVIARN